MLASSSALRSRRPAATSRRSPVTPGRRAWTGSSSAIAPTLRGPAWVAEQGATLQAFSGGGSSSAHGLKPRPHRCPSKRLARPGLVRQLRTPHVAHLGSPASKGDRDRFRRHSTGIGRWHAHEGRHTAVSTMSSNGVPIQEISDAIGHKSIHVMETVCRRRHGHSGQAPGRHADRLEAGQYQGTATAADQHPSPVCLRAVALSYLADRWWQDRPVALLVRAGHPAGRAVVCDVPGRTNQGGGGSR